MLVITRGYAKKKNVDFAVGRKAGMAMNKMQVFEPLGKNRVFESLLNHEFVKLKKKKTTGNHHEQIGCYDN